MTKRKQNPVLNTIYILIGVGVLLLIWEISSKIVNNQYIFPNIYTTFNRLFYLLSLPKTYQALFTSFGICLLTLVISLILALVLGTLSGLFEPIRRILSPTISIMKVVPTACITILLIIFVKSLYSTIIVIFLVVFPILYESIVNGIRNIDETIIDSLRLEGLYKRNSIIHVIIPQIAPYLYVGLVSSIGLSMKVEIMSEIIVGSAGIKGIGNLIYQAWAVSFDYIELFALAILTLISFGLVDTILFIIKKYLKKKINMWNNP